jgi:hypothetical protein
MKLDDQFSRQLADYLDEFEGMTPLPDAVRISVLSALPTTKQVGFSAGRWRRLTLLPNAVRFAGAGIAIVLVAALAVGLAGTRRVGPPSVSPSPSLTRHVVGPDEVPSLDTHRLTFMVPAGWTDVGGSGVRKNDLSLKIWVSPRGIWVNPCRWSEGNDLARFADPPFYQSLGMLDAFWVWWDGGAAGAAVAGDSQPTLPRGTKPTTTTVDGLDARHVQFRAPDDLDLTSCDEGEYRIWVGFDEQVKTISAPGELNEIWLLKVGVPAVREGGMVMIDASSTPVSSTQDLAELRAIVDSIQIVPAS